MADIEVRVGSLRWPVLLARRTQVPDGFTGITEFYEFGETVRADIQSIGALTFWTAAAGLEQTDTPVTHRIRMRWVDYLDQTQVVIRDTRRMDGSVRHEVFRVRRIKEMNGRKRFVEIEAELERAN